MFGLTYEELNELTFYLIKSNLENITEVFQEHQVENGMASAILLAAFTLLNIVLPEVLDANNKRIIEQLQILGIKKPEHLN